MARRSVSDMLSKQAGVKAAPAQSQISFRHDMSDVSNTGKSAEKKISFLPTARLIMVLLVLVSKLISHHYEAVLVVEADLENNN